MVDDGAGVDSGALVGSSAVVGGGAAVDSGALVGGKKGVISILTHNFSTFSRFLKMWRTTLDFPLHSVGNKHKTNR